MKVAILGWGIDTQDVEPYLKAQGHEVTVLDEKEKPFGDLSGYDMVVRSPGVYRYRKELKGLTNVTSKTKIFFYEFKGQIIGVTGTKGKGTTSALIYEILRAAGKDVFLGGNIGAGLFGNLDKEWAVLELSSFQLIDLHKSPHIAVVLMTTSEHADWHKDQDEYVRAKSSVTSNQSSVDFAIYNKDYPNSVKIGMQGQGKKIAVSGKDWIGPLRLRGDHNRENMAASNAVAQVLGIRSSVVGEVAESFKGLEHRLEEVATVKGVTYFEDSFSTTPETTIAAIKSFTEPIILIAGGSEKGSDFTELGKVISQSTNIKAVILIGQMAERIDKAITNRHLSIIRNLSNLKDVVHTASQLAVSGDVVLLSPAAASFDMFKNYKDRGEQFKAEVMSLRGVRQSADDVAIQERLLHCVRNDIQPRDDTLASKRDPLQNLSS